MKIKFLATITLSTIGILTTGLMATAATTTIVKAPAKTITKPIIFRLPTVPGLKAIPSNAAIGLSWSKPKAGLSFIGYTVFRSEKAGKLGSDIGHPGHNDRTFIDTHALLGHTYYYSVRYYAKHAISAAGRQVKARLTSPKPQKPSLPTGSASSTMQSATTTMPATASKPTIFSPSNPIVVPINDTQASAADKQRVMDLQELQAALTMYKGEQGAYPTGTSLPLGTGTYTCLNSDGWQTASDCAYPYMASIMPDPSGKAYMYSSDGTTYSIETTLDGTVQGLSGTVVATPSGIAKK